jgi:hypothetical protein
VRHTLSGHDELWGTYWWAYKLSSRRHSGGADAEIFGEVLKVVSFPCSTAEIGGSCCSSVFHFQTKGSFLADNKNKEIMQLYMLKSELLPLHGWPSWENSM